MTKMTREAAVMRFFYGGIKIHKLGSSTGIIIPPAWVRLNAVKVNGSAYAKLSTDGSKIIIEPIMESREKIKATLERNHVEPTEIS